MRMYGLMSLAVSCCIVSLCSGQRYPQQPFYQQPQSQPATTPAPPSYYYPPAPVHYVNIGEKLDGDYKFGYDTGNGPAGQSYREEFRLPDGSVKGSYGYIDSRGHMRKVHYTAGKNGFIILKDERITDKKADSSTAKPIQYHVTTPPPTTPAAEVVYQPVAPVRQAPVLLESRQVELQHQQPLVSPPVVPQKSAQELQAEVGRNSLAASSTEARQQYVEPESGEQAAPPPKPQRPRHQRRRKRPKSSTTSTTTTEVPQRQAQLQRSLDSESDSGTNTYVPPPTLVDSTHGLPRGPTGFGERLSGRRAQSVQPQSDQASSPDVQAERKPSRQRSRYSTRRTRRPSGAFDSDFAQQDVAPAGRSHSRSFGTTPRRRRVKVSRVQQFVDVEETTTPPTTTTTPAPTTTAPTTTVAPSPAVVDTTVGSTPGFVTPPTFPSAEQSFFKTHGLPYNPYNSFNQGPPQQVFVQEPPFAPRPQLNVQPQPEVDRGNVGIPLTQPFTRPQTEPQELTTPLSGLVPFQHISTRPVPLREPSQRPVYQLPGFSPGERPLVPQLLYSPTAPTFLRDNDSVSVHNVQVPGHGNTTGTSVPTTPTPVTRTVPTSRPPFQQYFNYPGSFTQQPPAPFENVQPAHVFGPPSFQNFPGQYQDNQFRQPPPPIATVPPFRRQSFIQASSEQPPQTTPFQTTLPQTTSPDPPLTHLRTAPVELTSPAPATRPIFSDFVPTTPQRPTPAPTTQSHFPNPKPTSRPLLTLPPLPPPPPPVQQQQYRTVGTGQVRQQPPVPVQPQYGNLGGFQQTYDPFQQYNGGFQLPNTLFSPSQQNAQQLGTYQLPAGSPFQAQFGSPYQPQYGNLQSFPQYQTTPAFGSSRRSALQDSSVQNYRSNDPPVIDRTLLSYDIGVPYGAKS